MHYLDEKSAISSKNLNKAKFICVFHNTHCFKTEIIKGAGSEEVTELENVDMMAENTDDDVSQNTRQSRDYPPDCESYNK